MVTDLPTDVKTVAYYVAEGEVDVPYGQSDPATEGLTGLVRRELDRSVTQWAANSGDTIGLSTSGDVIAPEVVTIEFQYFDGIEWYSEWDSEANSGVPVAIDVTIGIRPLRQRTNFATSTSSNVTELEEELRYYNLVVYLPISEPASDEALCCCCCCF